MKLILSIVFIIFSLCSYGQQPKDSINNTNIDLRLNYAGKEFVSASNQMIIGSSILLASCALLSIDNRGDLFVVTGLTCAIIGIGINISGMTRISIAGKYLIK